MRGYLKMFTTSAITDDPHCPAAAYPQATFETIDDAGHYSMLETPVRVASIVDKRVASAGPR